MNKSKDPQLLPIGEVANQTGLAVSAVRYYDEIGLINAVRLAGKRQFSADVVSRVNFIQRTKEAGFSLDEIRLILDDANGDWQALVDAKLLELIERRRRLDEVISSLKEIRRCGCQVVADCALAP